MEELPPELMTTVLSRLDGTSLAAAASSAAFLRRLSAQPHLWKSLCLTSWPSLRHHRHLRNFESFFRDAYTFPHLCPGAGIATRSPPRKLLWAVDLFHGGEILLSRFMETNSVKPWFRTSPFRIHALDSSAAAAPPTAAISPEKMELSWVLIDPVSERAANLSSRRPVSVSRWCWCPGEVEVRFAAVIGGAAAVVEVSYENGHLTEVSFTVEDLDGKCLAGRKSLELLLGVLHGGRTGGAAREARRRYDDFQKMKKKRKEENMREETILNMLCCLLYSLFIFIVIYAFR